MNKWFISFCLALLCTAVSGQITVKEAKPVTSPGIVQLTSITVTDAEAGFPLAGVNIQLAQKKKDTVFLVSNKFGKAIFEHGLSGDSVKIMLSCLGYKNLEYTHKISSPWLTITARMTVDPVEISSIIVQGEQIAMVVRGDTTIYNAKAFKTMRNDPMSELLKKLPGIEWRDGQLYAQGQIVRRILVNGTPLFGDLTETAGKLIKADEVENVKVYDQHSAQDIAYGDTLKPKDRVVDVTTKKKMNIIRQTVITTAAGIYLDKNASGNYEELYSAQGQYNRHMVGNNLMASAGYGSNASFAGVPTQNTGNDLMGMLNWSKNAPNYKYQFQSLTMFTSKLNTAYSNSVKDYFPTDTYLSRQQTNESRNRYRITNLTSQHGFTYLINKRHRLGVSIGITDNHNRSDNDLYSNMLLDDVTTYLSDMQTHMGRDDLSLLGKLNYTYSFRKPGRKTSAEVSYTYGNGWGKEWSVDTLATSSQNIFLTNTQDARRNIYEGKITYSEPLSKKTSLNLQYNIERRKDKSDRISIDRLTGLPDMANTYDFTHDYLKNSFGPHFQYRNGSKLFLNVSLRMQTIRQNRDEILPDDLYDSRSYTNLLPRLSFMYNRSSSKLKLDYSETVAIPSVEQLRGALNTYKAPLYTMGNPSLKETINRKIELDYTFVNSKTYSTWSFNAVLNIYQNPTIIREILFTSATVDPEFGDFEFPAGSTLQITENASNRITFNTGIRYATKSKLLRSSVNAALKYSYDKLPYYMYDVLNTNDMHTANVTLGLVSDFSRKIELSLTSATGLGYYERDDNSTLKEISEVVGGRIRWNFAKRLWLNTNGDFRFRNTTAPGTLLREVILNAELACTFGKADAGNISLNFNDLLNQARSFIVSLENDHINMLRTTILGRNIFLKLSYRF